MRDPSEVHIARTFPPAKLNLFLELLGRRQDGFHEIDTVMVPISWSDELRVRVTGKTEIRMRVDWSPSLDEVARQLRIDPVGETAQSLLHLPTDDSNLVFRALDRFRQSFSLENGFEVELVKQIPAGAGMGGASSDAASALRCAAALFGIPPNDARLRQIASGIGSDVPFFMGINGTDTVSAARGTGRGEQLIPLHVGVPLSLVVAYPAIGLSTAKVYSLAQIPTLPQSPDRLIGDLREGTAGPDSIELVNRLNEPAKKLAPQINEVLQSLTDAGLTACQMTGSGSACFGLANSFEQAEQVASRVRSQLQMGAFVRSVRTIPAPAAIEMIPVGIS